MTTFASLLPLLLSLVLAALVAVPITHARVVRARKRAQEEAQPRAAQLDRGPYRASCPPPADRRAAVARSPAVGLLVALQFLAPGLVAGLLVLPSDMAGSFAPCAVAAFALWCWGPLLATHGEEAARTERFGAAIALLIGAALLVPPLAHAVVVEVSWMAGARHHCAACPAVWMVLAYAVFTVTHALLMLAASRDEEVSR